ncbi:outer membrane protein assembly factor BamE [Entomobacter blattae]|uniref:Outer membrane protein assembly factor BamE n=1 Tax=Entomobacter blattae TaxID=2762277 RepID=A0A7H1NST4_9PROT|nr:outer membrane protein assembly factor BamE [Entomobacter blattae]QNT78844.1 Outer membrane protein assembly factor BamE [Entomobacter blattae]
MIHNTMKFFTAVGTLLALAACTTPIPHGSLVEKLDYDQLKPGTSTRADASQIMGSPTAKATFDENTWLYISQRTVLVPMSFPAAVSQDVVVLHFDQTGTLQNVKTLTLADAYDVGMVSEETPTPGTQISFLEQLLGNIGEYTPLSAIGSTFGPGASGNGPFSHTSNPVGNSGNTVGNNF